MSSIRIGGFSAAIAAVVWINELTKSAGWFYDHNGEQTKQAKETLDADGNYPDDGNSRLLYRNSVGKGRGSARLDFDGNGLIEANDALKEYDPDADLSNVSVGESIRQSITRDSDGVTSFRLSLAKNSRAVKIPAGEWDNFLTLMQANADSVGDAVAHYRQLAADLNAAAKPVPEAPASE